MGKKQTIPKSVKDNSQTVIMRLTQREYDTVLAALRVYQTAGDDCQTFASVRDERLRAREIAEDHGDALTNSEIDDLILRGQFDGKPEPLRRRYFAMVPSWSETKARTIDVIGGSEKDSAGMDAALKAAHKALGKSVHVKLIPLNDTKPNITVKI